MVENNIIITLTAMTLIAILEVVWVTAGHNTSSLTLAVGAISGLAGYKLKNR